MRRNKRSSAFENAKNRLRRNRRSIGKKRLHQPIRALCSDISNQMPGARRRLFQKDVSNDVSPFAVQGSRLSVIPNPGIQLVLGQLEFFSDGSFRLKGSVCYVFLVSFLVLGPGALLI